MKFQPKIVLFVIGACSLVSLAKAAYPCTQQNCFDCNQCNKNCANVQQNCDSDCIVQVRQFLCKMENENCKKVHGCDVAPVPISIYPASDYNESRPEWKVQTIQARKNCCYNLTGAYDNTLSGLKNNGTCVALYDASNCSGASVRVDSTWTPDCLKWIDCPSRINAGGIKFNDKTSSFKLC